MHVWRRKCSSCSILRSFGKLIISKSFQLELFERNVTRSIAIDTMFLCVNIHVYLFCVFFYLHTATFYRYKLRYAQLLSLISQSMVFALYREISTARLHLTQQKTECVQGMGVKKANRMNWRHSIAWCVLDVSMHRFTLGLPSLLNYSHWLEFSVQFFMLVLLITIFSGREFIHLFIYFHPYIFKWMWNTAFYL